MYNLILEVSFLIFFSFLYPYEDYNYILCPYIRTIYRGFTLEKYFSVFIFALSLKKYPKEYLLYLLARGNTSGNVFLISLTTQYFSKY